jgi:tyrosine-protein phosphatase YwqE
MEQQGVSEVWCTPHIMEDIPNATADLKRKFAELQAAYQGSIKLHLAAEYMLDNLFEERLQQKDLLPLGERGERLLVETSYFTPPIGLKNILLRIKSKGYYPVLAHPERYVYMQKSDYNELKQAGVLFQLKLASFAGMYGKEAKAKADALLRKGMYNLAGSDIHSTAYFQNLVQAKVKSDAVSHLLQNLKEQ